MLGQVVVKVVEHGGTPWWQVLLQLLAVAAALMGAWAAVRSSSASLRASTKAVALAQQQQDREELDRHLVGLDETRRLIGMLLKAFPAMDHEPQGDLPGSITNALLFQLKDDHLLDDDDHTTIERWSRGEGTLDFDVKDALERASGRITERIAELRPRAPHVGG